MRGVLGGLLGSRSSLPPGRLFIMFSKSHTIYLKMDIEMKIMTLIAYLCCLSYKIMTLGFDDWPLSRIGWLEGKAAKKEHQGGFQEEECLTFWVQRVSRKQNTRGRSSQKGGFQEKCLIIHDHSLGSRSKRKIPGSWQKLLQNIKEEKSEISVSCACWPGWFVKSTSLAKLPAVDLCWRTLVKKWPFTRGQRRSSVIWSKYSE